MPHNNHLAYFYFILSVGVAMMLRVMSWWPSLDPFNPDWVLLVLIYWAIAMPERFGVFTAWSAGLLTDVLTGRLLGQYALIFALVAYFSIREHLRLRQAPMLQQCLFVFFCLAGSESVIFGTESMKAGNQFSFDFWYPAFSGTVAWPLVFTVMRQVRQKARLG